MNVEKFEPRPVPAIVDAIDAEPEEFDQFAEGFKTSKCDIAKISLDALYVIHEATDPYDLVSQPYPSIGPQQFMENSELFRFLPNFEELVLKAVQSNINAANLFLAWFAKHQFIQMEFYEEIVDAALKTDQQHVSKAENLPDDFEQYKEDTQKEIDNMKYTKAQIEELQVTQDWSKLLGITMRYRIATGMNQAGILYALENLIKHDESQLEKMKEFFAQKERKM